MVGFDCVLEGAGEEDAALLVGCGVEGIGWDRGVGESFEERSGGKIFCPLGMVDELSCGYVACWVVFGEDEGAEEDAFCLAGGIGLVGADAFAAGGGGLL